MRLVLLDQAALVLAQLLADRLHLLAQEVVALLLLGAGLDVLADPAAHLQLGQPLALEVDRELQAGADVDLLQQAQLLLAGQVRAEPGGVGQRARLLDRAQEGGNAAVVAAQLEDLLDHGAVFAFELVGVLVDRVPVVDLLHLDPQRLAVAGLRGAGQPAVQAEHGGDLAAAARAPALDHLGDDADAAELAVAARQQEDPLLVAHVYREGRRDPGEDDRLVQRYQEVCHLQLQFL